MTIILASTSSTRRAMLCNAGVPHQAIPPTVEESLLKSRYTDLPPAQLATQLARDKALDVAATHRQDLVVGADQVLVCGTKTFNKPETLDECRAQLLALRGQSHQLISAVSCCRGSGEVWACTESATLRMRNFSEEFLSRYLEAEGNGVAASVGGYRLEGPGIQLFDRVDGDHFTILGLPLLPLLAYLRQSGELLS